MDYKLSGLIAFWGLLLFFSVKLPSPGKNINTKENLFAFLPGNLFLVS